MFNVEIFWNFDTGVQKNIFYFYPILHEMNPVAEISLLCTWGFNFHTLWLQFAL